MNVIFNKHPIGRFPLPSDPLADADLPGLRLLTGYLVSRYAPGAKGTPWLDQALASPRPSCQSILRLLHLARECPGVRRELDRWFDRELGDLAAGFEGRSVFELAAIWGAHRPPLRGRHLAAFLWVLTRRNDLPARRLAQRVAARLNPRDLMDEEILRA